MTWWLACVCTLFITEQRRRWCSARAQKSCSKNSASGERIRLNESCQQSGEKRKAEPDDGTFDDVQYTFEPNDDRRAMTGAELKRQKKQAEKQKKQEEKKEERKKVTEL